MSDSHPAKRRPAPLTIRFSEPEKAFLRQRAGNLPLGTFIRQLTLGSKAQGTSRNRPVRDGEALGQLLGLLGQSRIANNLNQLAKAANLGALPVLKETEDDLKSACAAVQEMRSLLLSAFGLAIGRKAKKGPLSSTFAERAGEDRP